MKSTSCAAVVVWLALSFNPVASWSPYGENPCSRRTWFATTAFSAGILPSTQALSSDELPLSLRDFTKLAPLGRAERSPDKTYNLPLEEVAKRLEHDLIKGSTGAGGYILTGDLSRDLFRDDCAFVDPTNRVTSLSQYQRALRILFDPEASTISMGATRQKLAT